MDNLIKDMFKDVVGRGIDKVHALKGLRALSRYYGGQQLYIPQKKTALAEEIIGVMADAIGESDAEAIYEVIASFYGGVQWYVPLEKNAFRKLIAEDIERRYDGTTKSMRKICREYEISYSQVYRLFYEARKRRLENELDFD